MREITCDESGYEGERLIGSTTRLFAHASVDVPDAAAVLAELRARIKSPAYKAGHLLREMHREVLKWFLGPDGPVIGRGHGGVRQMTLRVVKRKMRFLNAESHPQIQIADILAGTVRRLTEVQDEQLKGLLPPFVEA